MEDTRQYFECEGCGAEYSLHTDMEDMKAELMLYKHKHCPFCSVITKHLPLYYSDHMIPLEEIDWEYDDENVKRQSEGS